MFTFKILQFDGKIYLLMIFFLYFKVTVFIIMYLCIVGVMIVNICMKILENCDTSMQSC